MSMNFLRGLWSSQATPKIKEEVNSDEIGLPEAIDENFAREEDGMPDQRTDNWEGFPDEQDLGVENSVDAGMPKKKKKKRKKKRKSEDSTQLSKVETPQMGDKNSSKAASTPHSNWESTRDGSLEEHSTHEDSMLEDHFPAKDSKKVNGSAPKRKRSSKSKAAVLPEEDIGADVEQGSHNAASLVGASKNKSVTYVKHRKSSLAALDNEAVGYQTLGNVDTETRIGDAPGFNSPDLSSGIKRATNSHTRRILDEPATKSQRDDSDLADMSQPLTHAHIESNIQDGDLDASSHLQRDASSAPHPMSVNGEDLEEEQPKRPSKKALGKRKATEEPLLRKSNKKTKRGKHKETSGLDLRAYFLPSSDEASLSRRRATTSNQSPNLTDLATQVWYENNRISPEPPSRSQTSVKSPRPSWNAINNPVETHDSAELEQPLFVHAQYTPKRLENQGVASRRIPVVEIGPMKSTPSIKSRPTPAKSASKPPETPNDSVDRMLAAPVSKGKLSADQFGAIIAAVESYRQLCNLTEFEINEHIHADAGKEKFAQQMWKAICEEVPDIPRRNVISTCRRTFYNFRRGPWTVKEDEELKRAYEEHGHKLGKWKLIGETMNRFPEDARDRWRNYIVCGDTLKKEAWQLEEEKRLRAAVRQCISETRENNRLSKAQVLDEESLIEWGKVSELMGRTRSRLQCRDKWIQLKDREEPSVDDPVAKMPISETWRMEVAALEARLFSAKEKLTLLRAILDSGAVREGKIPWQTIKDDLNGKGKRMAWKYCFRKLRECVPGHEGMEFRDTVSYLINAFEMAAPEEPPGFDLPIEIFPSSQNTNKMMKRPQHLTEDNGEPSSSSVKKKPRKSKQAQENGDASGDGTAESSVRGQKFRHRMLKEGDSQGTANVRGKSASADIVEDVALDFESIKRTPKSARKLVIRKSKRNQFLSEEKVIEEPSDDEKPTLNGIDGDKMDLDHEDVNSLSSIPAAEPEFDAEQYAEQVDDEEDPELPAHRFIDGSPDLYTPIRGRSFKKKLASPIHINGYHEEDNEAVSSDGYLSDIPAVRRPRAESVEL